nr:fibronectin type III domain-containing protein [Bacteroides stercorirosoris]
MSDYTSAKTYSEIPTPENVRLSSRTATSITLAWNYPSGVADFHHYKIYRGDESDTYSLLTTINDISIKAYTDSDLKTGSAYKYKLRAVGLNGESVYSNVLDTRTLLPEECSPVVTYAVTNKIGTRITMTLDLPVDEIPVAAVADFLLTEEGNERLITAVSRDSGNHRLIHLSIPENSLQDYSKKTSIRLSYTGTGIVSEYGVTMDAFENIVVGNTIGNYAI